MYLIKYFLLILTVAYSFRINTPVDLQACASVEINTAIASIAICDQSDQLNSTTCITNYLNNTLKERWNVWIKSIASTDGLNYWTWNSCNVTFNNYGKYNRTFIIWTAQNYTYLPQMELNSYSRELTSLKRGAKTNNRCTDWQVWNAYYYINLCDGSVSASASLCIYNNMYSKVNQKWNVWVSSTTDKSALSYWSKGCEIQVDDFGKYTKSYFLWISQQ